MTRFFADTFFWGAILNRRDRYHATALQFRESISPVQILTTDEVLIELAAQMAGRGQGARAGAASLIESIIADSEARVVPQTRDSLLDGLKLYKNRPDKGYSLTDCISMQTMRREGIKVALTYDQHFAQEGFQALFREDQAG